MSHLASGAVEFAIPFFLPAGEDPARWRNPVGLAAALAAGSADRTGKGRSGVVVADASLDAATVWAAASALSGVGLAEGL